MEIKKLFCCDCSSRDEDLYEILIVETGDTVLLCPRCYLRLAEEILIVCITCGRIYWRLFKEKPRRLGAYILVDQGICPFHKRDWPVLRPEEKEFFIDTVPELALYGWPYALSYGFF